MSKQLLIWMLICLNSTEYTYAQWTKKDSVRLQNVLSGKEKLQLNVETMNAIQSGSLINTEQPVGKMRLAPAAPIPFSKDFSEYVYRVDTGMKVVDYREVPPALFKKYGPQYTEELRVFKIMRQQIREEYPNGAPTTALLTFSIADLTSRKAHVHKRNAKRSGTWQNYNNLPTPDIIKKKKKFINDHPEAAGDTVLALRSDTVGPVRTDSMAILWPDSLSDMLPVSLSDTLRVSGKGGK